MRWDIRLIERFMLVLGPVSSLFDFLTFYALLSLFGAGEALFQTGWFIELLATQCWSSSSSGRGRALGAGRTRC